MSNFNPMGISSYTAALQVSHKMQRDSTNRRTVLDGKDFLSRVKVKGTNNLTNAASHILLKQPISVSSFLGTRVSGLSQFWERYRWLYARVRYVPAVPRSLACQLIAYIDTDPLDDASTIPDVDQLLRQATSQAGSCQWNFSEFMHIPLVIRNDDQLYYTGDDKQNVRFSQQGVLYLLQVTTPLDPFGKPIAEDLKAGTVYLDWACAFTMPQINPTFNNASSIEFDTTTIGSWEAPTAKDQVFVTEVADLEPDRKYVIMPGMNRPASAFKQNMVVTPLEPGSGGTMNYSDDPDLIKCTGAITFTASPSGTAAFSINFSSVNITDFKEYTYRLIFVKDQV